MPKRCSAVPPSDKEILGYSNVPVTVAAKYVGSSSTTIMWALQEERAPYGYATQNPKTGTWAYNISPGALVKYKKGELPVWKIKEIVAMAAEGVEKVLDTRMAATQKVLDRLMGGT